MRFSLLLFFVCLSISTLSQSNRERLDSLLFEGYLAKDIKTAEIFFSEAESLIKDESDLGYWLYFKYYFFYRTNNFDSVQFYENKALPVLLKTNELERYFALQDNRYWLMDDKGLSEEAILHCKAMIQKSNELNVPVRISRFTSNLSNTYHNINFFEKGVETGKDALELAEALDPKDPLVESIALNVIAINFDDWGKPDSAVFYHRKVLGLIGLSDFDKAMTYNNIGNTFLKLNALDSAEKYIVKSLKLARITRKPYSLATNMNNLADVYLKKNQLDSVQLYLDSALHFAFLSESLEKKRDVYNTLYRFYEKSDEPELAVEYLQKFHAIKDSMVNAEKLQVVENIEKEAITAEKELELRKRNIWIVMAVCAILLLFALLRQVVLKRQKEEKEGQLKLHEERLRISRDLHDNIGAELTYMSSVIDQKLYNEENPETVSELTELGQASKNAMSQLRETIWAIKTEEITLEKFHEKLVQLSGKYTQSFDLQLDVSREGKNHLLKPAEVINLFRVCQEALNNSLKHAKCKSIEMRIIGLPNSVSIKITDDGIGYDLENIEKGYGLNNMEERIEELSGDITFTSEEGKGATVEVSVPVT